MANKAPNHFDQVALLITHYNRPQSLYRLLCNFQQLQLSFAEIIVSDDGSKPEYLKDLNAWSEEFGYKLVRSEKNKGLANNLNKGQRAVTAPFTMYVQEDFIPKDAFIENLRVGLHHIMEDPSIDLVRYYSYFPYPYTKKYDHSFLEMNFKWYYPGYMKFYQYSDLPHLRRSSFLEKFGPYKEGVNSDATEYAMCLSFLEKKGKGIIFNDINKNFEHTNNNHEPSTATFRKSWRSSKNPLVRGLRLVYLQVKTCKYHLDYFTTRTKTSQ